MFYILLVVQKPDHGYHIIQTIEEMTNQRVVLGPGTLYGALQSMMKKGWIRIYSEEESSRKKKEYVITEEGKKVLAQEIRRLEELLVNAKKYEEDL